MVAVALCALAIQFSAVSSASAQGEPLTGSAWSLADEAYKAYDARDYATAVAKAREAVRLRPDLAQLRRLLVNSLAAQGDLSGAMQEIERAVADKVVDAELLATRESLQKQLAARQKSATADAAYKAADEGYKAYARRDYATAIAKAREAIAADPSRPNYFSLLVDALQGAGRIAEAEREATSALSRVPDNGSLRLQRGYLRQRLGRLKDAAADFTAVLNDSSLTEAQRRNARLSLADVLLASRQPQRALSVLAPLSRGGGYEVAIRRGYAFQALDRQQEALQAFESARRSASNLAQRSTSLRGVLAALVALGRTEEARARFNAAYAAGELKGTNPLDLAYLANQVGEQQLAYRLFLEADEKGRLPGRALLDAAYAARRQFDNAAATDFFRRAVDAHYSGENRLDPQRLFEVRRDVATITRTWGATAALIYGSVGVVPNVPITTPSAGSTLQAGTEFYWRPPVIGFRNGATFDVFVRAFTTLFDRLGGPTGWDTTQGTVGARWKPLTDINLILEVGRLFRIGQLARDDWQFRVAYSAGEGGDMRQDRDSWWYWQVYAEANRFPQTPQTLASAEARFGHSFRMKAIHDNFIVTPFAAISGGYDSTLAETSALGAGPGINFRFWFREDRYTAPMSYVDLSVQYRIRLAGSERAEGWFAFLSLNY